MGEQFEAGNVVRLKSGGPSMTIDQIISEQGIARSANCNWFDKSDRKQGNFALAALERPTADS